MSPKDAALSYSLKVAEAVKWVTCPKKLDWYAPKYTLLSLPDSPFVPINTF